MEDPDILSNFLSITGCEDSSLATTILENNNWDVERSVDFFFTMNDSSNTGNNSNNNNNNSNGNNNGDDINYSASASSGFDDELRAPIPQTMDTLVDHEVYTSALPQRRYQKPGNVFEAFRDFEKERGINQDKLTDKQKTLAELFKPPLDILSFGTFDEIKKMGEDKKQFVLANIQDVSEFDCQKLNRDTWSNKDLKELISENFVFWQVNNANSEGKWFTQIYPVQQFPYIAIIDPRTGQKLTDMYGFAEAEDMAKYLVSFLSTNTFSGQIEPPTSTPKKQKKYNTEDEELELALALSRQESEKTKSPSPPLQQININNNNNTTTISSSTTTTTTTTSTTITKENVKNKQQQQDNSKNNNNKINKQDSNDENENEDEEINEDEEFYDENEDEDIELEDTYDDNYYYSSTVSKETSEEQTKKLEIKQLVEKVQESSKIGTEGDCSIQIRCPTETLKGQFHSTDPIKNLYYYVQLKTGIPNFKLFTSYPRVELTGDLMSKTLKEMDLAPRAVLMFQQN